ncbi:MAG TPA: hypothetical protein VH087_18815 [Thermoanaerobaculia bacterium]|jgi:hypothetical protein|nr:hypothetical protein [Thermoanaerobaculia bacterium]
MIKRLLILLVALLPFAAFGDTVDRDIVLTDDGTLYTVESTLAKDVAGLQTSSERVLTLTVQHGSDAPSTTVIPATTTGGWHVYPALAYDAPSKTLFVFWEAATSTFLNTQLDFCSYKNGNFNAVTSLDSAHWAARQNLRIAITRTSQQMNDDSTTTTVPETTVHAVWWEDNGGAEWARYAMITVDNAGVASLPIHVQDLGEFVNGAGAVPSAKSDVSRELLRHPSVTETRTHDAVDVLFGDMNFVTMRRVTIRPTIQGGRLRVPVGRSGSNIPAPSANVMTSTPVDTLVNGDSVAMYYDGAKPNTIDYLMFTNGNWSLVHTLTLGDRLSHDSAVTALQKLLTAQ